MQGLVAGIAPDEHFFNTCLNDVAWNATGGSCNVEELTSVDRNALTTKQVVDRLFTTVRATEIGHVLCPARSCTP